MCSKGYYEVQVIRLHVCVIGGLIMADSAAFEAFMYNDVIFFCIGESADRFHKAEAGISAVARIYIDVKGVKAKRAVIA